MHDWECCCHYCLHWRVCLHQHLSLRVPGVASWLQLGRDAPKPLPSQLFPLGANPALAAAAAAVTAVSHAMTAAARIVAAAQAVTAVNHAIPAAARIAAVAEAVTAAETAAL